MLRRRPAAVGCVLAAVALVVTIPVAPAFSAAQDVGKAQELRNPLSSGGASSARSVRKPPHGMIEALRRDLGLTAQEAQARLDNEIRYAPIEARLRRELGAGFGGSWLEGRSAQVLIVATTDLAATPRIAAAGAQPKIVARSLTQLTAIKDELDKDLAAAGEAGGFARYVDVRTNQVVIRTTVPEQTRNLVGLTGVSQEAVRVEASAKRFRPLYDLRGGDAYRIDSAWRCSVGFSATKGAQNGFVSAGHCGDAGSVTTGYNNVAQGVFQGSSFPGDDHSWITVNTNWRPTPDVVSTGGTIGVTGSREAIEGASVCRSGSTTGWHCGTVRQRDVTVVYDETQTVSQLTLTDACAEPGDSGGPFVSVDQAQGVLSGGNGNCTAGGETVFQPVTEILSAYGVSLVVDAPVPPETGCACPCYPRRVAGTLRAGGVAYQPSGSYYRTTAYRLHTGCLEGPAGSDFDLYLQRWNGRSWVVVASDTGPDADKSISYLGAAGRYRYRVTAASGSGGYTLGYQHDLP
ncbi:S1 family peptidase [Streptosporangium sp. NPDC048047]|uniref:S1 family peptidase n=1 Tax=Streptosporangium sp. NPDC048047 TaxID=3155748 RepID=UPI00342B2CF2